MGLNYPSTLSQPIIGSKTAAGVTTGITLESTYQAENAAVTTATKSFKIAGYSKANFDISYAMGSAESANTVEMILEHSPDAINWYRYITDTTISGVSTLALREWTFAGTAKFSLPVDIFDQHIRISLKETGVAANKGTAFVEVTLLGK